MADSRSVFWVQFDVGGVQRFKVVVNGAVVPTTGLACQVRLQRVNSTGAPDGDPVTALAEAVDAEWWRFVITAPMTTAPGDYQFEARLDNGAGEVKRFPNERHAMVIVRSVRTGGSA